MTTQPTSWDEIQIERLDDVPLLIGIQQRLGLDAIIDDVIPRHWLHQGASLGQLDLLPPLPYSIIYDGSWRLEEIISLICC